MLRLRLRGQRLARTVGRIGVDHKVETLLGGRQFRDVMLWVCSADMFLHRAIALLLRARQSETKLRQDWGLTYAQTALPTACAIVVLQRTDNLELVGARKFVGSGRHARRMEREQQVECDGEEQWDRTVRGRLGSLGLVLTMVVESGPATMTDSFNGWGVF